MGYSRWTIGGRVRVRRNGQERGRAAGIKIKPCLLRGTRIPRLGSTWHDSTRVGEGLFFELKVEIEIEINADGEFFSCKVL